jgi:hypothetical protein
MSEIFSKNVVVQLFKRTFPNYRSLGKDEIFIPDNEIFNAKLINGCDVKHASGGNEFDSGVITNIDNLTNFSYMNNGDEIKVVKREDGDGYLVASFGVSFYGLIRDLLMAERMGSFA